MPTYYAELTGGTINERETFSGGTIKARETFSGGTIYSGGGGGGATLQTKSVSYTPSESAISDSVLPDVGYDGMNRVDVSVGAIDPNYVGSEVPRKSSSDLSESGATVTAPAGYYPEGASKTIPNASTPTIDTSRVDSTGKVTVDIEINNGGYIGSGTYQATDSVALPTQGAQTIYPSTSDQSIASGKYLTGAQTIKGVTYSGLDASNIKKDVVVQVGDSADPDRIVSVTGTYEGGGGTITGDQFYAAYKQNQPMEISETFSVDNFALKNSGATKICLWNATGAGSQYGAQKCISNCTDAIYVVLPKVTRVCVAMIGGCTSMTGLDLGAATRIDMQSLQNNSAMNVLVLRSTSVVTLATTNALDNTPFASGKAGGTLYVSNSLISSYQSASNWSTILGYATNSIQAIEGSAYETKYVDGTTIPT